MMAPALARGEAQGGNDTFQTYQDYAGYGDSAGFAGNIKFIASYCKQLSADIKMYKMPKAWANKKGFNIMI